MKKTKILVVLALFLLPLIFIGGSATAFWGFGGGPNGIDCNNCHNEPGAAYYDTYATSPLNLDGNSTEPFWKSTYQRRMEIPVGSKFGSKEQFVSVVFSQNTTHLFILVGWEDPLINGTDIPMYQSADGFSMCWNINVVNFTALFASGMATPIAGEKVDNFEWKPSASETNTQVSGTGFVQKSVSGKITDFVMTSIGWQNRTAGVFSSKWAAAADYGNLSRNEPTNYRLELVRPLTTTNSNDLQFDHTGIYEFAIVVLNATAGSGHYVSFVHEVYVYVASTTTSSGIPGFELLFILAPLIFLGALVLLRKNRKI